MDHAEALKHKFAEKYVLGELPPEAREQFEEHYFDCAECAADLEALATLMAVGKVVAAEGFSPKLPLSDKLRGGSRWFAWLRPIVVVPAMATLIAVLALQNAGLIPVLKGRSERGPAVQVYESTYRLQGTTRGGSNLKISVNPRENFALDFDFTPTERAPSYRGLLLDSSGKVVFTFTVNGDEANKELHLVVPPNTVHAGDDDLVFVKESGTSDSRNEEVQHLSFSVELRP